jgi:hypothetical protein
LEIFDHVLLIASDPASEDQHQELQRQSVHRVDSRAKEFAEVGRNRRFSSRLSDRNWTRFDSADFWHTTGVK